MYERRDGERRTTSARDASGAHTDASIPGRGIMKMNNDGVCSQVECFESNSCQKSEGTYELD